MYISQVTLADICHVSRMASQTGHNVQAKTHRYITVLRLKIPTRGGICLCYPFYHPKVEGLSKQLRK